MENPNISERIETFDLYESEQVYWKSIYWITILRQSFEQLLFQSLGAT